MKPDLSSLSKNQRASSLRIIWRTAFEKNRKRTVERILAGQDPRGVTIIPEGSKEFWSKLFSDNATGIIDLAKMIKHEEDPKMALLSSETNKHEVKDILLKIKQKSAAGPDGITRGDIKKKYYEQLTELLNRIIKNSTTACSFRKFKMHLIP